VSRTLYVVLLAVMLTHCARTGLPLYGECEAGEDCDVAGGAGNFGAGARGGRPGMMGSGASAGTPPIFGGQGGVGALGGVGQGGLSVGGAGSSAGGFAGLGGLTNGGSAGSSGSAGDGGSAGSSGGAPALFCDDGAELELFVLSSDEAVVQLDPETLAVVNQHPLQPPNQNTLAMASDGRLFLGSWFGDLYTIDPVSGAVQQTSFDPTTGGFTDGFCVGWADSLPQAAQGALLINRNLPPSQEIYSLDPDTLEYALLGVLGAERAELVGDEQGQLFALATEGVSSAKIFQIDASSFQVVDEVALPGTTWSGYDIAYAGALYVFGTGGGTTNAYRISAAAPLHDQPQEALGQLDFAVIGAGARVCP